MIAARKNQAFNLLAWLLVARILRRRFHGIFVAGGENLDALDQTMPVIGCVNHTNWWDGFVLYVLSHRRLEHEIYLAMEERNLSRYRFFTWMGVFGVDLAARAANVAALRYAMKLLRRSDPGPAALVWMFVQGELVSDRRQVEARPGACFLAKHTDAGLLPLVIRYAWLGESRPSIFIRVGTVLAAGSSTREVAVSLNSLLARTEETLDPPDLTDYFPLFAPRKSIHTWWDDVRRVFRGRRDTFKNPDR